MLLVSGVLRHLAMVGLQLGRIGGETMWVVSEIPEASGYVG